MRVLIAFYEINNFGGILNNQEALYRGLRELGHRVSVLCLYWKDTVKDGISKKTTEESLFGGHIDYETGWTRMKRFAYKGKENLNRWKEYASKFDLIIWQIPVPSKEKGNTGNMDWLELYNIPVKQVVYIHDGNFIKSYPHLFAISSKLTGAVGVHPCAYHSLARLPIARAMAFSPQMDIAKRVNDANKADKERKGWFSLQTFKQWKHVDDIVRAVPYMKEGPKTLAGKGIHYHYMVSDEKVRPEYLISRQKDPDCTKEDIGRKIWDVAIENDLDYKDWVTNKRREKILHSRACLIDPSWALNYAKIGDHFNRVVIDALIAGAAPIARNFGISTNEEGEGELFKPNVNYFMIPHNAKPVDFAAMTDEYCSDAYKARRKEVVANGRAMLKHWDYRVSAQAFIDLANGKPAGYYKNKAKGEYSRKVEFASKAFIDEFFDPHPTKQRSFV